MRSIGAGLGIGVSVVLVLSIIASCLSKKPRDDTTAIGSGAPAPAEAIAAPEDGVLVAAVARSRPAPELSGTVLAPHGDTAPRDRADALFDDERWLEAGNAYLEALSRFPAHPDAEAILERALEAYEWMESEKQIAVLEEIFRRFPAQRTAARVFDHAVLVGVHRDPAAGISLAETALVALPEDAFRVYALRRVAGLHRAVGDHRREALLLEECRALASNLGDEKTVREIDRIAGGSPSGR